LRRAVLSGVYPSNLKTGRVKVSEQGERSVQAMIVSPTKAAYVTNQTTAGRGQLVKAAIRLAALFNAIQWQ
jgi:hypothetical protein